MTNQNNENKNNNNYDEVSQNEWMIRPCSVYDEEYSDCTTIKARFNQYFIFGHTIDCSQWKKDSINCYKWHENKDINAAKEVIESEKRRRKERLLPHYQNDVWEKRKEPPANWNEPLPEDMQKEYEYSYLNIKAMEMKGEKPPSFDTDKFSCALM